MSTILNRPHLPLALLLALPLSLHAPVAMAGADMGGYFRVMTRPDFQGGNGRLGYWNLYGRLLNEGPYAALEMKVDILEPKPASREPWTSIHAKIEGGSVGNADPGNGNLSNYRLSQLYVKAGNVVIPNVTWQLGTLDTYFGDLGLYDMRPAQLFFETVGLSARYDSPHVELLFGAGDSGYYLRGAEYNTIFTPGGYARFRFGRHLELGTGAQLMYEPEVAGNRFAPYNTPLVYEDPNQLYEDFLRGELVQSWVADNPYRADYFPYPTPTSSSSHKLIGYLGFGNAGPLRWNNFFASYQKLHPENFTTENYNGRDYNIYIVNLTDQRTVLTLGNEMQIALIPERLDVVWGALYIDANDADNNITPSDYDKTSYSTVLRLQTYFTETFHFLMETSIAQEKSHNGNAYREHWDSIFSSSAGASDSEGLETGDTNTRSTWQGKIGPVLNPLGKGIYTRPSIRLLYGVQYSNQNNAFGNSFVETIDQHNEFQNVERHWHHVLALETEVWF